MTSEQNERESIDAVLGYIGADDEIGSIYKYLTNRTGNWNKPYSYTWIYFKPVGESFELVEAVFECVAGVVNRATKDLYVNYYDRALLSEINYKEVCDSIKQQFDSEEAIAAGLGRIVFRLSMSAAGVVTLSFEFGVSSIKEATPVVFKFIA